MKKITPAFQLFLNSIRYKYKYFSLKGRLDKNGSFYYDDMRLSEELKISVKTIMRAKRYLKNAGELIIEEGRYKGRATKYWIPIKPAKMSPFNVSYKDDKMSAKPDKLSFKACQNVTPNVVMNNINKDHIMNDSERKEMHKAFKELIEKKLSGPKGDLTNGDKDETTITY